MADHAKDHAKVIQDYLKLRASLRAGGAEFVLQHGRPFEWRPRPANIQAGQPKLCYYNSGMLTLRACRFIYCEGYATSNSITRAFPVEHAWCVDRYTGYVVDVTWPEGGTYFGVPFRRRYVRYIAQRSQNGFSIILNSALGSPLVTGRHDPSRAIARLSRQILDR